MSRSSRRATQVTLELEDTSPFKDIQLVASSGRVVPRHIDSLVCKHEFPSSTEPRKENMETPGRKRNGADANIDTDPGIENPKRRRRLLKDDYTIGWICALLLEMSAALAVMDEIYDNNPIKKPHDVNTYKLGRIGRYDVVVVCFLVGG
jgi:hypothetical protein